VTKKLKLPIFFNNDDTSKKKDLGIETPEMSEFDIREVTFYSISAIAPAKGEGGTYDDELKYSIVYVPNGDYFLCCLPITDLEPMVDELMS